MHIMLESHESYFYSLNFKRIERNCFQSGIMENKENLLVKVLWVCDAISIKVSDLNQIDVYYIVTYRHGE